MPPAFENVPEPHAVQSLEEVEPVIIMEALPAAQAVHADGEVMPTVDDQRPKGHALHCPVPTTAYLPAPHCAEHDVALSQEYVPAGHALHTPPPASK